MKHLNKKAIILFIISVMLIFTACGKREDAIAVSDSYGYAEERYYETTSAEAPEMKAAGITTMSEDGTVIYNTNNLKLIYTAEIDLHTKEFNNDVNKLKESVAEFGGYVSNEYINGDEPVYAGDSGRYCSMTVRIPSDNYSAFINSIKGIGNNIKFSQNVEDVTDSYYDIETRLEVYNITKERIESLLKEATDMESIIQLNQELTDVTYEIESLKGSKKNLDNKIAYSTVNISIRENFTATISTVVEESFGSRIVDAFNSAMINTKDFFEGFVIIIVALSPAIVVIAVITVFIVLSVKSAKKRKAKKILTSKTQNEALEITDAEAINEDENNDK